ncbi:flagellar basal body P-ring formation chaperone FlgA [Photobacterium galatheae]|uniref:Flagella basal body P-ring formation protein FlgA n=1 Tax=Photobacterium galatheae TaxID=1654360 RepID=A0A066RP18_9GAMM|nr:flagellar basal body P-ring formation chaperone FlgA [Photobacterium galatheae]KDM90866.1 hypothetical protein EA58_13985 [Photobacterium galatheae]MCM0149166.1 flagellar basal body P-ring formation protein FlgA [Photobacterium galatheae]
MKLKIFYCAAYFLFCIQPLGATTKIEEQLLSYVPKFESIKYTSVEINDRSQQLLIECQIKNSDVDINASRLSYATFRVFCIDGKEILFSAKLDGIVKSLVAKNQIRRKTRLNQENASIEWVSLSNIKSDVFHSQPPDGEYYAVRNLRKGQPISLKNLTIAPVIERGWLVKAKILVSNIAISIDVKALEDGVKGDVIQVENTSSGNIFYAKVINSSTVMIE